MKTHVQFFVKKIILPCFLGFSFLALKAGDISVSVVIAPDYFYTQQDNPFNISIQNQESFSVDDVEAVVSYKMMGNPTVLQQNSISVGTVNPLSTVNVSTFNFPFYATNPGMYEIQIDLNSSNDINPANDQHTFQVNFLPRPSFNLFQVDMDFPFDQNYSNYGVMSLQVPPVEEIQFANLFLLNTTTDQWVRAVHNAPLIPFSEEQTIDNWFDFSIINHIPGNELGFVVSYLKISQGPIVGVEEVMPDFQTTVVDSMKYDVRNDNPVEVTPSPPSFTSNRNSISLIGMDRLEYRGCDMANIDLDNGQNASGAGWTGDQNACGPAAAANSMQWLADHDPNIPDNGQSIRDKMKDLASFMDRQNNAGVTTEQLVKGKLGFIDKHKLPIKVKYSSWFNTDNNINSPNNDFGHKAENKGSTTSRKPPSFDFLMQEMLDGEDVEVMWGWYDSDGNRHGGHWVSLSGATEVRGIKYIWFKDDAKQGEAGGTRHSMMEIVEHPDGDWFRVVGFDGPNNRCWVESVVSESYDSTVIFTGVYDINTKQSYQIKLLKNPIVSGEYIEANLYAGNNLQARVSLYSIAGKLVSSKQFTYIKPGKNHISISTKGISEGIYILKVDSDQSVKTVKVVIE